MVVGGTTRAGLLRREQRGDALPPRIGQVEGGAMQDLDRERALRVGVLPRSPRRVAALRIGLVPAAKGRPGEAESKAVGGLGERQQQAANFRYGERNQPAGAPCCSAVARCLVTSR